MKKKPSFSDMVEIHERKYGFSSSQLSTRLHTSTGPRKSSNSLQTATPIQK